jgi:hypothetical protein
LHAITLRCATFTDAANQAGISRRYGGIHFKAADVPGRAVGQIVYNYFLSSGRVVGIPDMPHFE